MVNRTALEGCCRGEPGDWQGGRVKGIVLVMAATTALEERIGRLESELRRVLEENARLREENTLLRTENVRLTARVAELEARLKQDSSNSHKPPSSDPKFKAGRLKARRTGRKPGGQPGHKGVTRAIVPPEQVTERTDVLPPGCSGCGADLSAVAAAGEPFVQQVVELPPIQPVVREYRCIRKRCPTCGKMNEAAVPPEARHGTGPHLTAWAAVLSGRFRLSRAEVADLLSTLLHVPICKGTVQACCERASAALAETVAELEGALPTQPRLNLDETGWRQRRVRHWLWIAVAPLFACFALHRRRGSDQLDLWFPTGFTGIAHSDRWSAYRRFDAARRQLCWAHLFRDLQAIVDAGGPGRERAEMALAGAAQLFETWHTFLDRELTRSQLVRDAGPFIAAFQSFCADGAAQSADRRWRALGANLLRDWPAVFRFVDTEGVDPTNNTGEQRLRQAVLWRRSSQGTRSDAGSAFVARMLTVGTTCQIQARRLIDFVTEAVDAALVGKQAPSLLGGPSG